MKRVTFTLTTALLVAVAWAPALKAGTIRIHNQSCSTAGVDGAHIRLLDPKAPDAGNAQRPACGDRVVTVAQGESLNFSFPDQSPVNSGHNCKYSLQLEGSDEVVTLPLGPNEMASAGCAVCDNGQLEVFGHKDIKNMGGQVCGG